MTFVGTLRHDGIVAPCVLDGSMNGQCFVAYKHHMRMAQARTAEETWKTVGKIMGLA